MFAVPHSKNAIPLRTKEFTENGRRYLAVEVASKGEFILPNAIQYKPLFQLSKATEEDFAKVVEWSNLDGLGAPVVTHYKNYTHEDRRLSDARTSFLSLMKKAEILNWLDLVLFEIKSDKQ